MVIILETNIPQICLIRNFIRLSGSLLSSIRLKDGELKLSAHWEIDEDRWSSFMCMMYV